MTRLLVATLLSGAAIVATLPAGLANPKGGQVIAGSATISSPTPVLLDIVQSTNRAVIDWQSFDIAVGERTLFQQPSAASITLNRVLAANPSAIAGQLSANGSLVLINPSGVVFSNGAQVDVHSIIATPSDISNANFMAGKLQFDQPSPNPNASILNAGTITVAQKGLAALVAPSVANSGVIAARLGKVVLGGAETFTVDFYGDGLINFDVGPNVTTVPLGPGGKPVASLVSNTGRIDAAGGTVLLTADAAAGLLANVVDSSGRIDAPTTPQGPGTVIMDAGAGNGARLVGTIDVSGAAPGQTGGTATVTGGTVTLASTAQINARGSAGGGTVKIGGGPHGTDPSVRNAQTTYVAAGALIDASATDNGNGGNVAVWSDGSTVFNGTILAKGGPNGGNGGWVETSGHVLSVGGSAVVDASAPLGASGTWLLDPFNTTISTSATVGSTGLTAGGTETFTSTATGANVNNGDIQNTLNLGTNVTITTGSTGTEAGNITVNAPVSWTTATTLTLNANNSGAGAVGNIIIDAAITGSNASSVLVLNAGGTISQTAAITAGSLTTSSVSGTTLNGANAVGSFNAINTTSGDISLTNTATTLTVTGVIEEGGGNVTIGNTGALTLSGGLSAGGGDVNLTTTGALSETGGGRVVGANLLTTSSVSGTVLGGANEVVTFNATDTNSGDISLTDNALPLSVSGVSQLGTGNVSIRNFGALMLTGTVSAAGGAVNLTASVALSESGSGLVGTTGLLTTSSAGGTALGGANTVGSFNATNTTSGDISLTDTASPLTVTGVSQSGGGNVTIANTGALLLTGALSAGGGTVELTSTGTISQTGGIITAASLTGSAVGGVSLNQANAVAGLGSFIVTGGDLLLTDGGLAGTLTVSGPVSATNVTISGPPTVSVTGSISATSTTSLSAPAIGVASGGDVTGSTVHLNAGGGGIAFTGTGAVGQSGGIVDIDAAGDITEASTAIITAGTLESTGGVSGSVSLLGTGNSIAGLGTFPVVGGDFALLDAAALTVSGTASVTGAGNQLSLQSPNGITIGAAGALQADASSGLVSLQTDTFSLTAGGTVGSATFELAPSTVGGSMTLGASGAGLSLPSLTGFTAGNLIVGAVTPPGGARTTTAGSITIGGAFDTSGVSTVTLDASGAVTQTAALNGGSQVFGKAGSYTLLDAGNAFSAAGFTATAGHIQVADGSALIVSASSATGDIYIASPNERELGAVSAGGTLGLQTDSFSFVLGSLKGNVVEFAPLTSGTAVTLGAAGGLSLLSDAFITTSLLRVGAVTVPGSGLTTTAGSITVGGNFGGGALVLELDSLGTIGEAGGAVLTAGTLSGSSAGGTSLTGANLVADFGPFTNAGAGGFALTDAQALTVNGAVDAGTGALALTTTSGNLSLGAGLTAGTTATLISAGTIDQTGGIITANKLTGSSAGGASLTKANLVGTFGPFSNATSGLLTFTDAQALATSGTISSGGALTLTTTGAGSDLSLGGNLTAGSANTVTLTSGRAITQTSGVITANALTVTSVGTASLLDANAVGPAGNVTATVTGSGNGFLFRDTKTLNPSGVTTQGGRIALSGTGGNAPVHVQSGGINSHGGEIDITASSIMMNPPFANAGTIASGGGTIVILADGMGLFGGTINAGAGVVVLGPLTTTGSIQLGVSCCGGLLTLLQSDLDTITAGALQIGYRNSDATASLGGNIDIAGNITINTSKVPVLELVTGTATGTVTQSGGSITSNTGPALQLGVIAGGAVTLTNAGNSVGTLAGFTDGTTTGFSFTNSAALTIGTMPTSQLGVAVNATDGTVSSAVMATGGAKPSNPLVGLTTTGPLSITTNTLGNLVLDANLTASGQTVDLISAGTITQNSGVITASSLGGSSVGGASLTDANLVGTLGPFSNATSGLLTFTDAQALATSGTISSGGDLTLTTTTGNLVLGTSTLDTNNGGVITLTSAGTITQAATGVIDPNSLLIQSVGPVSLIGANTVDLLAASITGAGSSLTFNNTATNLAVDTVNAVNGITTNGGAVTLSTTTSGNIALNQPIAASGATPIPTVTLTSAGTISEPLATGTITASSLTGSSAGGATLNEANLLTDLGPFTNTGAGGFALTNVQTLNVTGAINSGTGALALTTTSGNLVLGANLIAGTSATFTAAGTIALDANVTTGGTQTYNSAVTLGKSDTLTSTGAGNITFAQTVDGGFGLTVNTAGTTAFGGRVGNTTALTSLTTDAPGTTDLNGLSVRTTGTQTYNDPVLLTTANLLTSTGAGNITFAQTVDGTFGLTVNTAGTTAFDGRVGNAAALASLTTDAPGTTDLNGLSVRTTGTQTYNDPVLLTTANLLTSTGAGNITFAQTVDGTFGLTVNTAGTTAFDGRVGNTTPLTSLTTDAPGATDLNGLSVRTTGTQTYGDPVLLTTANLLTSTGAGNITFAQTVDGTFGLTVNTAGTTAFDGRVGSTAALASLTTDAPGTTDLNGLSVKTTGTQTYGDPVLLTTANLLTSTGAGDITFSQTVDGTFGLTVNTAGTTAFDGRVGNATALTSLTATGVAIILEANVTTTGPQNYTDTMLDLNGTIYKTTGATGTFTESGATVLTSAATIDTSAGNQAIVFRNGGAIDAITAGAQGLTLNAGTGNITIAGAVGTKPLASLTATGGLITLDKNVTTVGLQSYTDTTLDLNGASYKTTGTSGTFTESGATVLTNAATVDTSAFGQAILFQTPGTINGAQTLVLNAGSGNITIAGAVGTTPLASLAATGGTISLDGNVTTAGALALMQTGSGVTLALAHNLTAGTAVTLISKGAISQTGGIITAPTLTGSSVGGATLDDANLLTDLGAFTNTGTGGFTLTNAKTLAVNGAVNAGTATLGLTIASGGNLGLAADLTAGTTVTLTSAGTLDQTAGIITAATLTGSSDGGAALNDANLLTNLGVFTNTGEGGFALTNAQGLNLTGAVAAGAGALTTSGDLELTVTSGTLALPGSITLSAGKNIVLASDGGFTQSGTLTVASPDLVIDTTDKLASALLSQLLNASGSPMITDRAVIANSAFDPAGTSNPITFHGALAADNSIVLLLAGKGPITGGTSGSPTITVKELGVSGTGGTAALFGSISGDATSTAAQLAKINPRSDNNYRFNDCVIGSASCIVLPTLTPVVPQAAREVDVLLGKPPEDDIDAPLINIFDEERLCEELLRTDPERARRVCR